MRIQLKLPTVMYVFSSPNSMHDAYLDLLSGCVKNIDQDNDGRIDRHELVNFAINLTGQIQALQKKNQSWMKMIKSYRRGLVSAVGIIVLLCASLFGVSVAVAELTKDVAVSSKGVMTRAGTDDLVKTGVSGLELVALAPADDRALSVDDQSVNL